MGDRRRIESHTEIQLLDLTIDLDELMVCNNPHGLGIGKRDVLETVVNKVVECEVRPVKDRILAGKAKLNRWGEVAMGGQVGNSIFSSRGNCVLLRQVKNRNVILQRWTFNFVPEQSHHNHLLVVEENQEMTEINVRVKQSDRMLVVLPILFRTLRDLKHMGKEFGLQC